jgi:hypothetical protein
MRPVPLFIAALFAAAPTVARATVYDEFAGLRSQAMGGAHRGLGTSNDTMFLNPAGMISYRRYSVDLSYGFTSFDDLSHISISAVDSKSGPVAGAAGYTHDRGDPDGSNAKLHRIYMGAAYPISQNFGFGITVRHIRGDFTDEKGVRHEEIELYNGDVGVFLMAAEGVGIGFTYHNLIRGDYPKLTPPSLGVGGSYTNGPIALAADISMDVRDTDNRRIGYHLGGEYFIGQEYPIRLGWKYNPFIRKTGADAMENIVSAGLGWISQGGALEATFAQSIERERNWSLTGALKFFL